MPPYMLGCSSCLDGPLHNYLSPCVPPCMLGRRPSCFDPTLHACLAPCMVGYRPAASVALCILGRRLVCLDGTLHALMPVITVRFAYSRLKPRIYASACLSTLRIQDPGSTLRFAYPSLGASMRGQIRRHTPKCAKNAINNRPQQGFEPAI